MNPRSLQYLYDYFYKLILNPELSKGYLYSRIRSDLLRYDVNIRSEIKKDLFILDPNCNYPDKLIIDDMINELVKCQRILNEMGYFFVKNGESYQSEKYIEINEFLSELDKIHKTSEGSILPLNKLFIQAYEKYQQLNYNIIVIQKSEGEISARLLSGELYSISISNFDFARYDLNQAVCQNLQIIFNHEALVDRDDGRGVLAKEQVFSATLINGIEQQQVEKLGSNINDWVKAFMELDVITEKRVSQNQPKTLFSDTNTVSRCGDGICNIM